MCSFVFNQKEKHNPFKNEFTQERAFKFTSVVTNLIRKKLVNSYFHVYRGVLENDRTNATVDIAT